MLAEIHKIDEEKLKELIGSKDFLLIQGEKKRGKTIFCSEAKYVNERKAKRRTVEEMSHSYQGDDDDINTVLILDIESCFPSDGISKTLFQLLCSSRTNKTNMAAINASQGQFF